MNLRGLNSLTMFEKNHSKYSTVVNCDFKSDFFEFTHDPVQMFEPI